MAEYTYDYQSRRIARRVASLKVDERYLYEGWNLIAVYNAGDPEPEERYTWGKDLNGTLQGAGGVGGLLIAKKRTAEEDAWIYHYDANGNVTELTANTGQLLDQYRYNPFGQNTAGTLTKNRYQFSTKPTDSESALLYYGYRYYDPIKGRWPSRDPIAENGGLNLYGFLSNNGFDFVDVNGLRPNPRDFWSEYPDYQHYPTPASAYFLAGGWLYQQHINQNPSYDESCALRVSVGLNESGNPVPHIPKVSNLVLGKRYILGASQIKDYFKSIWGDPDYTLFQDLSHDELRAILCPNQLAVGASNGHAGVVAAEGQGYEDGNMKVTSADVWILTDESDTSDIIP